MKHLKTHHLISHETNHGTIIIEGPVKSSELKKYEFHEDLTAFRPAPKQFKALIGIAELPEGRIIIARTDQRII